MRGDREGNLVLVADDNNFVRFLIKKWLGSTTEIVDVENGTDVLETYQRIKPDVLFLDIHLPGKNGKDILKEVMDLDPSAFVVMLSADSKKENVIFSVRTGAKAFMTKPFTRDTLNRYFSLCPTISHVEGSFAADIGQMEVAQTTAPTA